MGKEFGYRISFRLRHPTIAVSVLTECMDIAPAWSWQVGEARRTPKGTPLNGTYTDSYCTFDIASGEDGEVAKSLRDTTSGLVEKREFIRQVCATGGSAAFYVFWYPNGDTGEIFEASLLSMLGDMGISLMLNVYDDREANDKTACRSR